MNKREQIKFYEKRLQSAKEAHISICKDIDTLKETLFKLEGLPQLKKLIGHCYKYRSSYSCPEKQSDYWWLYIQVLKIESADFCCVNTFQKSSDGHIRFEFNKINPLSLIIDRSEIPLTVYNQEKKKLIKFIKEQP